MLSTKSLAHYFAPSRKRPLEGKSSAFIPCRLALLAAEERKTQGNWRKNEWEYHQPILSDGSCEAQSRQRRATRHIKRVVDQGRKHEGNDDPQDQQENVIDCVSAHALLVVVKTDGINFCIRHFGLSADLGGTAASYRLERRDDVDHGPYRTLDTCLDCCSRSPLSGHSLR